MKHFRIAAALLFALSFTGSTLARTELFIGTWKLNAAKSKFVSGSQWVSETRIVIPCSAGLKFSIERVNEDGTVEEFEYTASLSGKSYPIFGQRPYGADTITGNYAAPNAFESILKRDGKVIAKSTTVVSADGKVLTVATKGKDDTGNQFLSIAVYDKQ